MEWDKEALERLEKVPSFVRGMAKSSIEKAAREKGLDKVSIEIVEETREKYFSLLKKKGGKRTTNIAIVRCNTVSEVCPGVGCLKAFNQRKIQFEDYGPDTQLIGFFTCGGCSGRRVSRLVDSLMKYDDLHVVHLSSCMLLDGDYPKCPFKEQIKKTIEGKGVKVVEGTHH